MRKVFILLISALIGFASCSYPTDLPPTPAKIAFSNCILTDTPIGSPAGTLELELRVPIFNMTPTTADIASFSVTGPLGKVWEYNSFETISTIYNEEEQEFSVKILDDRYARHAIRSGIYKVHLQLNDGSEFTTELKVTSPGQISIADSPLIFTDAYTGSETGYQTLRRPNIIDSYFNNTTKEIEVILNLNDPNPQKLDFVFVLADGTIGYQRNTDIAAPTTTANKVHRFCEDDIQIFFADRTRLFDITEVTSVKVLHTSNERHEDNSMIHEVASNPESSTIRVDPVH